MGKKIKQMSLDFHDIQSLKLVQFHAYEEVEKILFTYGKIRNDEISLNLTDYIKSNSIQYDQPIMQGQGSVYNPIHQYIDRIVELEDLVKRVEKVYQTLTPAEKWIFEVKIIRRNKLRNTVTNQTLYQAVLNRFAIEFVDGYDKKVLNMINLTIKASDDVKHNFYQKIRNFVFSINTKKYEKHLLPKELEVLRQYKNAYGAEFTFNYSQQFYIVLKRAIYSIYIYYLADQDQVIYTDPELNRYNYSIDEIIDMAECGQRFTKRIRENLKNLYSFN